MKPYAVEVSFTMIVMADNEVDAQEVAEDNSHEAWRDTFDQKHCVLGPVTDERQLNAHGWSLNDIPWGGDGETSLRTILAELPPVVEQDTRTIDMFSEAS
ncbi:hypothetical protein AB4Y32_16270 [Paraburkholderia phymatum]|uniref:Uncharacterized protein n=1 Tax=Paraburkholderia phymatum TaxID=148447 RepID=A0ACC6U0X0_9BURK